MHGGKAAIANITHGKSAKVYARTFPSFMREAYEEHLASLDILKSVEEQIAMAKALQDHRLSTLAEAETPAVSDKGLETLISVQEHISKLLERHHNITHKQTQTLTYQQVQVIAARMAAALQHVVTSWVSPEDQKRAKDYLRDEWDHIFGRV